jgi:hypothetical protein
LHVARAAAAAMLAAAAPGIALACSVCSRGDPIAPAAEAHGEGGDLRLALDAEVLSMRSGTPGVPSMHDELGQQTLKLTAAYSPIPPVNLVLQVPFLRKRMTMDHGNGTRVVASDLDGVGDVEVGARWFFWEQVDFGSRLRQGLAVSLGSSLPTGPNHPRDLPGQPNGQHEQIGTGAFGPYAGLAYRVQRDDYAGLLSISARGHNANSQGYRFGSALLWTLEGQWTPRRWLALGLGLDGHAGGRDRRGGAYVDNTGGLVLWASPSAYLNVHQRLWLTLRAQLPVRSDLVGDQTVRPVVLGGFQYVLF